MTRKQYEKAVDRINEEMNKLSQDDPKIQIVWDSVLGLWNSFEGMIMEDCNVVDKKEKKRKEK